MAWLILAAGGQAAASRVANVSADTINNLRKPDWKIPLNVALALCQEASMSLDWLATGYQVRPDLGGAGLHLSLSEPTAEGSEFASHVRLKPLHPQHLTRGNVMMELWEPSSLAFEQSWLTEELGTSAESARYAYINDDGMAPGLPRGAMVIVESMVRPPRSGIYLVELGDELLPRRLNRQPDGGFELVADADLTWRYTLPDNPPTLHRILWSAQDR